MTKGNLDFLQQSCFSSKTWTKKSPALQKVIKETEEIQKPVLVWLIP